MKKTTYPIIEIHGTGIHNRGAELMAIAISEKLKKFYPDVKITVPPNFGFPADIKKYGFLTTAETDYISKKGWISLILGLFSGRTVTPKAIDIVLDASGFAFSDQWGEIYAKQLTDKMNKKDRKNQLLILLPQALGPFENLEVKNASIKLFNRSALIFARDKQSYNHSISLIDKDKIKQCSDFTIAITPQKKLESKLPSDFVSIVPNMRMMDKSANADDYLNFLRKAIQVIKGQNLSPVFIAHDAKEDLNIIPMLGSEYENIAVYQDEDPRVLKWILGQSRFVIGSRFHALVSTLSQGVPCIGAGWSHKYPELFADFSTRETLIDDLKNTKELEKQIKLLSDNDYRDAKSKEILGASNVLKLNVEEMWVEVKRAIDEYLLVK